VSISIGPWVLFIVLVGGHAQWAKLHRKLASIVFEPVWLRAGRISTRDDIISTVFAS
jgi:hypothetical protein